jgi:phosphohistidine phosphatase
MDLFLIRHAKAADGALYADDAERPLTADGRRAALDVGASLARHGVQLDALVVSPLVRAVETAELIAVSIGYAGALSVSDVLAPEGRPQQIIERAVEPHQGRVALVGHLPSMGHLLSALLARPGLSLGKGAVVRLRYERPDQPATLVWVMTPRHLEPAPSLEAIGPR